MRGVTSFADFFVICSGTNPKQIQAISEEIGLQLEKRGEHPVSVEGFENAEWILADYGDYLIHVFSPKARTYYGVVATYERPFSPTDKDALTQNMLPTRVE